MNDDRIPARGLLAALCATALVLDFCFGLVAVATGRWIYLASLVLVGALTYGALQLLKGNR